ncbi:NADH-quinone oxidoreductase subunit K [Nocardioidaceae bacterium]|nr:NADH-quinone oxidoreductase subunit K [Nocardioidaceae bacterium]
MIVALGVGVLTASAVYLLLDRSFLRVVLGFIVLSHVANLVLFAAGGTERREAPLGSSLDPAEVADALPHAFALTAIVIAFSITIYMLVLAVTGRGGTDQEETP